MNTRVLLFSLLLGLFYLPTNLQAGSCVSLATKFFETRKLSNKFEQIIKYATEIKYKEEELIHLREQLARTTKFSKAKLESYLLFIQSLNSEEKYEAIELIADLTADTFTHPILKRYHKSQKKLDKYQTEAKVRIATKLKKEHPDKKITEERIKKLAILERNQFEKITYNCMARTWNTERVDAMKNYRKFVMAIGMTSGVGSYTYNHWDEEKNARWFGNLGYDISMGMFFSFMKSKIITNPKSGAIAKGIQKWLMQRGFSVVDIVAYPLLFDLHDSEQKEELDKIMNDPDYQEEINKLLTHFENQRIYQKVKSEIIALVEKTLPEGKSIINAPEDINDVDWKNLKKDDLKREDVQDIILTAALMDYYEQARGDYIITGQRGADRYLFHAAYSGIFAAKDIPLDLWIYNTLCTGVLNPKLAMFKALSIYAIDKVLFDQVYYFLRRESIGM